MEGREGQELAAAVPLQKREAEAILQRQDPVPALGNLLTPLAVAEERTGWQTRP